MDTQYAWTTTSGDKGSSARIAIGTCRNSSPANLQLGLLRTARVSPNFAASIPWLAFPHGPIVVPPRSQFMLQALLSFPLDRPFCDEPSRLASSMTPRPTGDPVQPDETQGPETMFSSSSPADDKDDDSLSGPPAYPHLWSRNGFEGPICVRTRATPGHEYLTADGNHLPYRVTISDFELPDRKHSRAQPVVFATNRDGVTLAVSGLSEPTPYAWRNVEFDELHFVQEGAIDFLTDFGCIRADRGDFVLIPRAVTYCLIPQTVPTLRIIVESPEALRLNPPAPFGMINLDRDVSGPDHINSSAGDDIRDLWLRGYDGITRFTVPQSPLTMDRIVSGAPPVWRLNIAAIQPATYFPHGGPPSAFLNSESRDLIVYPLSARPGKRPPQHHNADYDEITYYFAGPAPYGNIDVPGTLSLVPKGVTHWGPEEDVPEGYIAWMLECRGTLRITEAGATVSRMMETGQFGIWQSTPQSQEGQAIV